MQIDSFRGKKPNDWATVVTKNPKGGITENFVRIQRGDHSNLLGK